MGVYDYKGSTISSIGDTFTYGSQATVTLVTLVAPAANINGIRLVDAGIYIVGGGEIVSLIAKGSAPSSYVDNPLLMSINTGDFKNLPNERNIPAGMGLYILASGVVIHAWHASYEVL